MWWLLALAWAAEPTRCVASWTGPEPGCALSGSWSVDETGPTSRVAERGAHEALVAAGHWYSAQWRYQQIEASLEAA